MNHANPSRSSGPLLAALAILLAILAVPVRAESGIGEQAPRFDLADSEGQQFHFPGQLTGPTIVLFWATWCPYCKALMPHLQSIVEEYDGAIEVLALNFRDDGDPQQYLAEMGYDFRLFPSADVVAAAWGVKTTPGLFLVDVSGRVVFSNFAIAPAAYARSAAPPAGDLKHYQKAARRAPVWAAELRKAIDRVRQ
jgi:cytochrome c biogenesis protein CcmG/thiol:disulfide interchange protein DsbE